MSKRDTRYDLSYTQNRELSWLKFNERVLEEAEDERVPLLERLKFAAIFTSNLDEFFMVRVGSLIDLDMIEPDERDSKSGKKASEQLDAVFKAVAPLIERRDVIYEEIMMLLERHGVYEKKYDSLSKEEKKYVEAYYRERIEPLISPQVIDRSHPFPHLRNKELYAAAMISLCEKEMPAIVGVPPMCEDFVRIFGRDDMIIRTEEIILNRMDDYFGAYKVKSRAVISVTRNADISLDDEKFDDDDSDYRSRMSQLVKKRDRLRAVRLEVMGRKKDVKELAEVFAERLSLGKEQIYYSRCPLKLKYAYALHSAEKKLEYDEYTPVYPSYISNGAKMIDEIKRHDVLLFYPIQQMKPFLDLLKQAASDKRVVSICITLYRVASNSIVARHLCEAAENGKEVTVMVELRARFDESNNIEWAKRLEEAGCRVIYGPDTFKCHSKICLITMKEKNSFSYITQIGTGNYNEKTAKLYTDFSLMTANKSIAPDASKFFKNMLLGELYGRYEALLVAPLEMKSGIMRLINSEAAKGRDGRIIIKANSVTEREMIDALAAASQKGVKTDLIIRGICCILPHVPGKTDNISVRSIVGRFLEHSRVYVFGKGDSAQVYISSADIMTRNQTRRVEIACPIYDKEIKEFLISYLNIILSDTEKARMLLPDGRTVKAEEKELPLDSQKYFMENPPKFTAPKKLWKFFR